MQNEQLIPKTEATETTMPRSRRSASDCSERTSHRRVVRIALPWMQRRQLCLEEQKIRAARHAAELAEWRATGGDFLRSARPEQIRL